ncbi:MAG: hypothetical protein JXA96_17865 [Sedimentisphaerales bacterium]|nr:hypothetical protein [Sedimentisphaerales bacterium]
MNIGGFLIQSFYITVILLISANMTSGKTITVGIENAAGLDYDYEAIQPAIDAAEEGDTVLVAEGSYRGAINFKGKNIILTSNDPNDWDVVTNTRIYLYNSSTSSNQDTLSVVTFSGQENENCVLQGIELTYGDIFYPGAINYGGGINGNGTKATINKCYIYYNNARYDGGGIYNCDGLIENCTISDNNARRNGGGLYGCDGIIRNCTIKSNGARGEDGGGLHSCNGQIINCTIRNNSTKGNGGGLNSCNAIINDCLIKSNQATFSTTGTGGGLYNCNTNINNCTIEDNTASSKGGGLYGCNGTIIGCTIKKNESTDNSGGGLANCMGTVVDCTIQNNISSKWHAGGAIDCNSFENCTITGNTARGYGGGLYNCKEVDRCTISGNSSEVFPGGGLSDCNSVINSIISGNISGGSGAGLYDCSDIINCTIAGNYSQKKAGALYLKKKNGIIDNTIIWDNLALEGGQILVECNEPNNALWNLSVDYSDIQYGPNDIIVADGSILKYEPNNIDTYPMFVQPGSWTNQNMWIDGDYHLLQSSPCIDSGNPDRDYSDQNDIDGDARLIGQYVDMGADEAQEYIPPVFVQLEMSGPHQVKENETGQYITAGRYDDDTQVTLTNEVTWSVEPEGIATIDSNGLFTLGELNENIEVTIRAIYTPSDQEILYMAQMTVLCMDVPMIPVTYYVDTATGNDLNYGLSRNTAFKTIQKGIDASQDGDTVMVYPGVYREGLVFWGKNITLTSAEDAAVIENPNNIAVLFCFGETDKCKILNFVIRNSEIGILNILGSSPTIKNLTIVNNNTGIECFDSNPEISNCIFWDNEGLDFENCLPEYSCMEDDIILIDVYLGNTLSNPLFVAPDEGDYHLKSERGRYWPLFDIWVLDYQTSPCIDAGNPEDDFIKERQPNGGKINMGAYGNTSYASMSFSSGEQYKASMPNPSNGGFTTPISTTLSWTPGVDAIRHDVYLGTSLEHVRDATRDNSLGVIVSLYQNSTSFTSLRPLEFNTEYFWRIDEIDSSGTITKGNIWVFTTYTVKDRSCFTADTPVWADGKMVEISKVVAGQMVGKADCAMSISGSIKGLEEHGAGMNPCYEMTLESGNTITIVHSHYFKTVSDEWKKIEELSAGMQLQTMNGPIAIKSVIKKEKPFFGKSYNLMLDGSEQYFVGKDGVVALDCSKKTWEILEEVRK